MAAGSLAGHPPEPGAGAESVLALVVGPARIDEGAAGPTVQARQFGFDVDHIAELRLVHVAGRFDAADVEALVDRLLVDPVEGWVRSAAEHRIEIGGATVVDVGLRPGVTDREGAELVRAASLLGLGVRTASVGRRYVVASTGDAGLAEDAVARLADAVLHNPVIERWAPGGLAPAFVDRSADAPAVERIPIRDLADPAALAELSTTRRLGLTAEEMGVIRDHFRQLDRDPTDAEIETLAQTWSEHCSHKTFRARITYGDTTVDGLLRSYLRAATDAIDAPYVVSAFVDNAGIVSYDGRTAVAIKAETHNHPSALEPFGGANTGVGGVVRDILGVSAKPVAITDILCFGPEDLPLDDLPPGVLHPRRIRSGVIAGIGDYGNKIGVPTIAGAIVHDPSYTTTPLVFAGCLGVLPVGSHPTEPRPGDAIVVLGGAVGRDGVGGATFSSQEMGVETAEVAGSSVQIGDPIVEKGLIDVVVAARDRGLYHAITDCGAGGLSSAVGEMAAEVGAEVDLALVPRKYPGLAPWEVWLSEAQERMVVATAEPETVLALAGRWQVGAQVIGRFTGTGRLVVTDGDTPVVDLDTGFLHDGRPGLELVADARPVRRPDRRPVGRGPDLDLGATDAIAPLDQFLLGLLAHPSIRSNEGVVRTYDHEVQGRTLVRPYGGVAGDGPADGTVISLPPLPEAGGGAEPTGAEPSPPSPVAVAVGIGVNVVIGRYDTEAMAWAAIDEAVRNAVAAGADPDRLSLLDNFAWANPTRPEALGALVAACRGCHDAALVYRAPFVSGKDSLYNEFRNPDGTTDPVTPTLVITAIGPVETADALPLTGVVAAGDDVWLVGPTEGSLGGSHLDDVLGADHGGELPGPDPDAPSRHRQLHAAIGAGLVRSVHDLAEGGLAVAAAEWALGGRLGLDLDPLAPPPSGVDHDLAVLFGEGPGRYLVEVAPEDRSRFAERVPSAARIGSVVAGDRVRIGPVSVSFDEIATAYTARPPGASDRSPTRLPSSSEARRP